MPRFLKIVWFQSFVIIFYSNLCFTCDIQKPEKKYRLVPFRAAWAMPFPGSSSEYTLRKGSKCIAVLSGGQDIGGISYRIDNEKKLADIDCLFLHPDYRSKGLGSRLLKEALRSFEALGCSEVLLVAFPISEKKMVTIAECAKKAKRLVSFYERHGFEIDDRWRVIEGEIGTFMRRVLQGEKSEAGDETEF